MGGGVRGNGFSLERRTAQNDARLRHRACGLLQVHTWRPRSYLPERTSRTPLPRVASRYLLCAHARALCIFAHSWRA